MGFRVGDAAPMAFVELVDRPEPVAADEAKTEARPRPIDRGGEACARVHERPASPVFRALCLRHNAAMEPAQRPCP